MATTTKISKNAAPKTTKSTTAAPNSASTGVASPKKAAAVSQGQESVTSPKESKKVSKTKPQSPSEIREMKQRDVPDTDETLDNEKTPQSDSSVVQAIPLAPTDGIKDPKWLEIRVILEKLKDDTLREIRKSVRNGAEAAATIEPGGDIYDQASSERDRELGLLLGDREREKIHNIDEALLRIEEGDYGICEECDEEIPLGRLKAMPFTRHCVKCKSDLEKMQAQTKRVEEERAYREIPLGSEEEES